MAIDTADVVAVSAKNRLFDDLYWRVFRELREEQSGAHDSDLHSQVIGQIRQRYPVEYQKAY